MSVRTSLHFDLAHLHAGTTYSLSAFGRRHVLKPHGPASLQSSANRLLALANGGFSHFLDELELPPDEIQILRLYGPNDSHGIPSLVALYLYVPAARVATAWEAQGGNLPPKLVRRGIAAPPPVERRGLFADAAHTFDATDTAVALVFNHPELMVLTAEAAALVAAHLHHAHNLGTLANRIESLGAGWVETRVFPAVAGKPVYQYDVRQDVLNLAAAPTRDALARVADDERLRGIRWRAPEGLATVAMASGGGEAPQGLALAPSPYQYVVRNVTPKGGLEVGVEEVLGPRVRIRVGNSYVRHVSIYARFFDAEGKVVPVCGDETIESKAKALLEWLQESGTSPIPIILELLDKAPELLDYTWLLGNWQTRFIDSVSPVGLFLGVPVDARPTRFLVELPKGREVSEIKLFLGSLGQMSYVRKDNLITVWYGASETLVLDMILPALTIVMGTGMSKKSLFDDIFKDPLFFAVVGYDVYTVVKAWWDDSGNVSKSLAGLLLDVANKVVQKILASPRVAAKLAEYFLEEELAESIPLVGTAMRVAALTATTAGLLESVSEVIASPAVVEVDLTLSLTARVALRHDQVVGDAGFPATAKEIVLVAHYSHGTNRVLRQPVVNPFVAEIEIVWAGIPIGGSVTFAVAFLSKEGWLVGRGSAGPVANLVPAGKKALEVTIQIEELEYPLAANTTYLHARALDASGGELRWRLGETAPVDTVSALSSANGGHNLSQLGALVLDSDAAVLGYAWRASGQGIPLLGGSSTPTPEQVWAFQNVSLVGSPGQGRSTTERGLTTRPQLAYLRSTRATNGSTIADATRTWDFFVDPRRTDQGFHLRAVPALNDPAVPATDPRRRLGFEGPSWGTFPVVPDDLAVHPSGVIVGVVTERAKLLVLDLPSEPGPDRDALPARVLAGPGLRAGLLRSPVRLAVAADGTVLVLEAAGRRLQAFDVQGNPVRAFAAEAGQPKRFFAPLHVEPGEDAKLTFTGLALEVEGHVYVTSYEGTGFRADQFRLDVYLPTGAHLFRQRGLEAAAATVDLWRNLYTLNFQKILGPGERTQPSVSEYVPSTPKS